MQYGFFTAGETFSPGSWVNKGRLTSDQLQMGFPTNVIEFMALVQATWLGKRLEKLTTRKHWLPYMWTDSRIKNSIKYKLLLDDELIPLNKK